MGRIHRVKANSLPLGYRIRVWYFWTLGLWGWLRSLWHLVKVSLRLSIRGLVLWSLIDLFASPGLKQAIHESAKTSFPALVKEDPARPEEEARQRALESIQARCHHITRRNGLWNYFCPLCGKKLIDVGDPPMWQI